MIDVLGDSAVELDPELSDAWALKGLLHLIYEQFGAAIDSLQKSKKNPGRGPGESQ